MNQSQFQANQGSAPTTTSTYHTHDAPALASASRRTRTGRTHSHTKVACSTPEPKAVHVHRQPVHVAFGEDPVYGDPRPSSSTHELSDQAQASTSRTRTPAGPHAPHVHIDPAAENPEPEAEAEHEQRSATDVDVDVDSPSQLSMLTQLVTQMAQVQLTQATRRFSQKVPLAKLHPGDDVEAFLTSFERSMRAYRVPPDDWVYLLSPQLTDKALLAYTELASTEADSYDRVKEAILHRYAVTPETSRRKFRGTTLQSSESMIDFAVRVRDTGSRWLSPASSREAICELILLEQFLSALPFGLRTWLRERKPSSLDQAASLAQDYLDARDRVQEPSSGRLSSGREQSLVCHICQQRGHMARDCSKRRAPLPNTDARAQVQGSFASPRDRTSESSNLARVRWAAPTSGSARDRPVSSPANPSQTHLSSDRPVTSRPDRPTPPPRRPMSQPRCYNCRELGHIAIKCPNHTRTALFSSPDQEVQDAGTVHLLPDEDDLLGEAYFCSPPPPVDSGRLPPANPSAAMGPAPEYTVAGYVNGTHVPSIVVDTACGRTMVHRTLVRDQDLSGETTSIRCAHGDVASYPMADLTITIDGMVYYVKAAVSEHLPRHVLLGRDGPHIHELVRLCQPAATDVLVSTRAQAKASPESTGAAGLHAIFPFEDELFEELASNAASLRAPPADLSSTPEVTPPPISAPDLPDATRFADEQRRDPSLSPCWDYATGRHKTPVNGSTFCVRQGLLYREYSPDGEAGMDTTSPYYRLQLVLPTERRSTILHLGHTVPMAGHMGQAKTSQRILLRFWWPTILQDVAQYCSACEPCQRTARVLRHDRAPLIPLPVIGEPFRVVAIDIIGPLQRTQSGKKYILTLVDYATRYPEAVALSNIESTTVADALISIFSRVGLPDKILSDQGSNFTSDVLRQVAALLRIQLTTSTPYHQQTNGLVERFNGTLKGMLRRFAADAPRSWDEVLPYALFAYREVPQASTGFSPFELLYGRHVRGPLDLVRDAWAQPTEELRTTTAQFVLTMRDRLERISTEAGSHLATAQQRQKAYYDRLSRERTFAPGDEVLLLLPASARKMEAVWQGPYPIRRKVDKVNYEIDMGPHRTKRYRVFHINLLRRFRRPQLAAFTVPMAEDDPDTELLLDDCSPLHVDGGRPTINPDLSPDQRQQLDMLLSEFEDTLSPQPGRTTVVAHSIHTGDATPIRSRPYRLAAAHHSVVRDAVDEMLDMGVIRASRSPWSSPVVLVPKKDDSIRFCVDYRALNQVAQFDCYPMPRVDEILDSVGSAQFLSTLDLSRGYWQIPLAEDACAKTAFTTPFGLYEFTMMPFGLHGAPATFQRCMDTVLAGLPFVLAYLDDVVIFSPTFEDHLVQLRHVLGRLHDAGLTVKPKKCLLGMVETPFLGHVIGHGRVRADPGKLQAIDDWRQPTTKKALRSFLGLCGYYRRLIPHFSTIAEPLVTMTSKGHPNTLHWTTSAAQAFVQLKGLLVSDPVIVAPNFAAEFYLHTDASDVGLGAVLTQRDAQGTEHPVAYAVSPSSGPFSNSLRISSADASP
ncbi:uncharacterized protein LOC135829851 [Sycon ciliatum]|uniref:uncharacterized protein LOC135829851 n=1 Tax=Sycon ciliatum TaxID=27933 RepID=UPI0031F6D969